MLVLWLVSSTTGIEPGRLLRWLYKRSAHYSWQEPPAEYSLSTYIKANAYLPRPQRDPIERMFSFQCFGTALGCSGLYALGSWGLECCSENRGTHTGFRLRG